MQTHEGHLSLATGAALEEGGRLVRLEAGQPGRVTLTPAQARELALELLRRAAPDGVARTVERLLDESGCSS